ncbi:LemA family protein [Pedobacter sp. AW1-32]|uniref:LemA family protein n=1 Tax=Pedobacter sp. AW1-32 TaxID=3383026 RepID=UPI003FF1393F
MIIAIIILVILLFSIFFYNGVVGKRNQVTNAFSAIDVMLKKRFDLIPNLVEVVKQYTNYEQETLSKIVELRTKASAGNLTDLEKANVDSALSSSIRGLMVNVENYPDLKANANFINLQSTWTESEEQIAAARRTYNSAVTEYNNSIMMFPGSIFASLFNFQPVSVLETAQEERANINARDLFNR